MANDEWGPSAWKFLHMMSFAYPDSPNLQEQEDAEKLFTSLKTLLPCSSCRDHFSIDIESRPPDTRSRATLSSWLVDLHNRVNIRLGKPIFSFADAEALYSSKCTGNCGKQVSVKTKKHIEWTIAEIAFYLVISFLLFFAVYSLIANRYKKG